METLTTLVCLFHHEQQAQAAFADLRKAGIPESSAWIIGGGGSPDDALDKSELASIGMPDRDYDHLRSGIRDGGVVVFVSATADKVSAVETIFGNHRAGKIDDVQKTPAVPVTEPVAAASLASNQAIPVIEENLTVGKRTVDAGGVRLYQRVVEIPVEESVVLREEHVRVDRVPTDRAISDADSAFQARSIELTETAEEAVVGKSARVVEEITLSKAVVEHTETVRDTVRHTEVEVEELEPTTAEFASSVPSRKV